jgi:uncharacterized protein with GYD domain
MVTVIVQHEVKDFKGWKKIFDADNASLEKAGVKLKGLYTSVKNPNDVTMIFKAPDAETFDKVISDTQRQKDIQEAGVVGALTVSILKKVK